MKVVPFQSEQSATIFIEVDDEFRISTAPSSGLVGSVAGGREIQPAMNKLKNVSETIVQVCRSIYVQVQKGLGAVSPDELVMEFGVKLGGEAGIPYITKGTAEAAIKVIAKWKGDKTNKEGTSDV